MTAPAAPTCYDCGLPVQFRVRHAQTGTFQVLVNAKYGDAPAASGLGFVIRHNHCSGVSPQLPLFEAEV